MVVGETERDGKEVPNLPSCGGRQKSLWTCVFPLIRTVRGARAAGAVAGLCSFASAAGAGVVGVGDVEFRSGGCVCGWFSWLWLRSGCCL